MNYSCCVCCSACSQKLLEWQDTGEPQRSDKIILSKSMVRESKKKRSEGRKEKASNGKKEEQKTTVAESKEKDSSNQLQPQKTHRRRWIWHLKSTLIESN